MTLDWLMGIAGFLLIVSIFANYPEPLRVWDKTVNKPAGDVMWNFSPTKQQAFTLEPGKELSLSYRIYVLDKKINATTAEVLSDFDRD